MSRELTGVRRACARRRFKEGDLNVGENSCIDRCSAKYWQVRVRHEWLAWRASRSSHAVNPSALAMPP